MPIFAVAAAAVATVVFLAGRRRRRRLDIPSLQGKHVFITGASSGIGLAIAKKALEEGAFVTLSARNEDKLQKSADSLVNETSCGSDRIKISIADVGDHAAISAAVEESFSWKPIDILVSNAGYTRAGYFDEVPAEVHLGQVQTNLMGAIYTIHSALPLMKSHNHVSKNKLSIVIVSSGAGLFLLYGSSVYSATKHALKGLAECLYLELLPYNINVNLVCPGFVDTALVNHVDTDGEFDALLRQMNLYDPQNMQTPETVAKCTLEAVKSGSFLVIPNPMFFPLVVLTRGMLASTSFTRTVVEAFFAPIIRLLTFKTTADVKRNILKLHHRKKLTSPSTFCLFPAYCT